MSRHPLSTRRSSRHRHRSLRQPFSFLQVAAILAVVILPGGAFGQIREERELDEPPMDQPAAAPEETRPDLADVVQRIIDRTNKFRQEHGLKAVAPNEQLAETVQYFSDFMARTGKYGHTADKNTPAERAEQHEYNYCMVSENIGYQFRSTGFAADELAGRFITGWKESPEHRENMLDPDIMEIGVAVARAEDAPTYFAVQMFGRPDSAAISFQVSNESETEVEYTVRRSGSDRTFPLGPKQRRSHQRCRPTTVEFRDPETTLDVEDGARYVIRQASDGSLEVTNLGPKPGASAAFEGREAMSTVCRRFPTAPAAVLTGFVWTLTGGTSVAQLAPGRSVAPFDADQAREHQEAWAEHHDLPIETTNDIGMVFVLIPPGEFAMGSPESDPAARASEMPQRVVEITRAFYLGKYPVTQEQWVAVMGRNPSYFRGCTRPVESVSWFDCQDFLRRLNKRTEDQDDRLFRLPTEAEWEYACRAGSTTHFSFGDDVADLGCYAWHGGNSGGRTQPVGLKRPNAWGLYDMHGNVWEWCYDWFDRFYYDDARADDPTGPDTGGRRVLRGGSWSHGGYPHYFRSAARYLGEPDPRRLNTDGFRVVWTIPPP